MSENNINASIKKKRESKKEQSKESVKEPKKSVELKESVKRPKKKSVEPKESVKGPKSVESKSVKGPKSVESKSVESKKSVESNVEEEPKKRGRKKKSVDDENVEIKPKRKRGRRAAPKFYKSDIRKQMPYTSSMQDTDKKILHLDIKESEQIIKSELTYGVVNEEYRKIEKENKLLKNEENENVILSSSLADLDYKNENDIIYEYIEQIQDQNSLIDIKKLYEDRLQTRLNQDNILIKKLDNLKNDEKMYNNIMNNINTRNDNTNTTKNKNKKKENQEIKKENQEIKKENQEIKEKENQNNFFGILNIFEESWLKGTDVCCWWCCHTFDSIPIGLPIKYIKNKFIVKGVYCSFSCMLAYNKNSKYKSLIHFLYKKLTGNMVGDRDEYIKNLMSDKSYKDVDESIKNDYINSLSNLIDNKLNEAPDKCVLKMFGGKLSIEEFRNLSNEKKICKMVEYPMFICRDYIEKVDLENIKNINKRLFVNETHYKVNDEKKIADAKHRLNKNEEIKELNNINRFIK
jgi:hypothetical protein